MRFALSVLLAVSAALSPIAALAQSADVEAKIVEISTAKQTITLDDGETYVTPTEFDFEGLDKDVTVDVFYTIVDGKRVINDLEIVE
ncbi:uncharacterized protein DUF1344 [Hoeflea marina]|uniref:Uncharacterized protein DUF1344 n=1 Tax=Hoeflea marina TaxID=274592 RepID=A0A317PQK0_9HYPH|nr:DUF1344 domain-containing protein [Hoeflea marina]PWW01860.1 uncharacterized protein DUF1344 [Hoeflea marina]